MNTPAWQLPRSVLRAPAFRGQVHAQQRRGKVFTADQEVAGIRAESDGFGLGQLLGSDPQRPLPPVQQGYADEMLRGARHLLELINDVLDLGRVESGHLGLEIEAVALEPLVAETLALVRPLAQQRDVQLSTVSMPGLAVRADRRRLKQVLLNLISNAIKYNRRPGSVRIECRLDSARVRVGVRDTGRGLSAAELARLFQPFERLDAARRGVEGSGIGLALSRRLVEAMGGSLDVDNTDGYGPENYSLSESEGDTLAPGSYAIRVHYYSGMSAVNWQVRVVINENQPNEQVFTRQGQLSSPNAANISPTATGPDWAEVGRIDCVDNPGSPPTCSLN